MNRARFKKLTLVIYPKLIKIMPLSDMNFKVTVINMFKKVGNKMENFT